MQCTTDCCIGKMSLKHFDITIKRLKQLQIDNKVKFLKTCEQFKHISSKVLAQFIHFWKPMSFFKNQVVYKKGQPCKVVYLIKSGEFEQLMSVQQEVKVLPKKSGSNINHQIKRNDKFLKNYQQYAVQVALLMTGRMLGDVDALHRQTYSTTTKCKSMESEVLAIDAKEFVNLVQSSEMQSVFQNRVEQAVSKKENVQSIHESVNRKVKVWNKMADKALQAKLRAVSNSRSPGSPKSPAASPRSPPRLLQSPRSTDETQSIKLDASMQQEESKSFIESQSSGSPSPM